MKSLKVYTLDYFKQKMVNKFFPRKLIMARDENAFNDAVRTALSKLNENIFYYRAYEFYVTSHAPTRIEGAEFETVANLSSVINLNDLAMKGVTVNRVCDMIPSDNYDLFLENYNLILGKGLIKFNILRSQDDFIEYFLSLEFYKQLMRRTKNYQTDYFKIDDRIILGGSYRGVNKVVVFFIPQITMESTEWELYNNEENFVSNYLEALVSYREGRSQSEMKVLDMNSNADDLKNDGLQNMEKLEAAFKKTAYARIGKRF